VNDEREPESEQPDRVARGLAVVGWTVIAIFGVVILIAVLIDVTGAWQELPTHSIINESDETLQLIATNSDGVEVELATLRPGERYTESAGAGDCVDPTFFVRTANGEVFARQPHQMCAEDEWIITGPDE
jgi:hypothetical protein